RREPIHLVVVCPLHPLYPTPSPPLVNHYLVASRTTPPTFLGSGLLSILQTLTCLESVSYSQYAKPIKQAEQAPRCQRMGTPNCRGIHPGSQTDSEHDL